MAFVLSLLSKEPTGRPRDARVALEQFETLDRGPTAATLVTITEEEFDAREKELLDRLDRLKESESRSDV